jgi:alkylation response protein AidB-like acyl-CoA dehydrogenase
MAVTNMVGEVIAHFGSDEQKRRYLPQLTSGMLGAFALSEVGAGSDPAGMATTARRDGDDWILNGTKQWISHGDTAGVLVVWARTGDAGPKGISCFLVDGDTPGLSVARHEDKMGLRGSHTVGLVFEDMRVPASALLGSEGSGFRIAMMALDGGRIGIASQALGIAEAATEKAKAYLREHSERSAEQAVQTRIADCQCELDAAELMTLRAAWMKERQGRFSREASMAKVLSTESAWRICNRVVDTMGAAAWRPENDVERHLRDVRVTLIYEGTSEIQRTVIARHLLRA